jgi:phosphoribosylaminoimidazolecarboxamide formyltransferase / IMP cyclohydrolase
MNRIKRAIISVSDKTGIVDFCRILSKNGVEILSTGGTFSLLETNKIKVKKIEEHIEFPEILDGRVKTLNPRIHGGILAVRSNPEHMKQIADLKIAEIDLVVVNLYPFEKVTASMNATLADAIENIDIGGNTLIRAAAKNWEFVSILCRTEDYTPFLEEMEKNKGSVSPEFNFKLAKQALLRTAEYDMRIAEYLNNFEKKEKFPSVKFMRFNKVQDLRYGENSHQLAAFYDLGKRSLVSNIEQLQGKELSYNNIVDLNAVFELSNELKRNFKKPGAVIIKHTNPCGTALGGSLVEAYKKALASDPVSAYGGIIGLTEELDGETAAEIAKLFYEIILAPSYSIAALEILNGKKNLRVVQIKDADIEAGLNEDFLDIKKVRGGILLQDQDNILWSETKVVTKKQPSSADLEELKFAFLICKYVKSNAIVYTRDFQTTGVGAGQMNRVDSAAIGISRAGKMGLEIKGSFMASDAYFPFRDSIDAAAAAGVSAIIQPGGSIRDNEVIAAADEHGIPMIFSGTRHFRH